MRSRVPMPRKPALAWTARPAAFPGRTPDWIVRIPTASALVDLRANNLFGLRRLHPAVGLLVAVLAAREGIEACCGEECGC